MSVTYLDQLSTESSPLSSDKLLGVRGTGIGSERLFSIGDLAEANLAQATIIATEIAAASTAAHNADAGAHLNIVRRTLAGNLTLTTADAPSQRIIPDADRDVTLPAESTAQWESKLCHGGAAYVLTIKRAGGTVVAVLVPGGVTVAAWDGVEFGAC